jgi:hypothetical protein
MLSESEREVLDGLELLLNDFKDHISIVSQGCSCKLIKAERDAENDGVILTCQYINVNDYAHRMVPKDKKGNAGKKDDNHEHRKDE